MEFLRKLVEIIIRKHRQLKRLYRAVFALSCIVVFVTSYALTLPAITLDRETAEASAGIGEWEVQGQAAPESGESDEGTDEDRDGAEAQSQEENDADPGSGTETGTESNTETDARSDSGSGQDTDAGSDREEAAGTESAAAEGTDRDSAQAQEPESADDAGTAGTQTAPVQEPEGALLPEGTVLHAAGNDYDVYVTVTSESKVYEGTTLEVREITKDSDEEEYRRYFDKAQEELYDKYDDRISLSFARFYDISLVYKGVKTEPAGNVTVRIEYKEAVKMDANASVDTIHFDEKKAEQPELIESEMKMEDGHKVRTKSSDEAGEHNVAKESAADGNAVHVSEVEFESGSFSVYGIVGTTIEEVVLASDGNNYEISATYGSDTGIPVDARLEIEEITEDSEGYADYVARTESALGMEEGAASYIRMFDIKIVDPDDSSVRYQPADGTTVDMKIELADAKSEGLSVVHFADDSDEGDIVDNTTESGENGTVVAFAADGFSVYVVADHEDGEIITPRVTFHFIGEDYTEDVSSSGYTYSAAPYEFVNKNGEYQTTQILKNGEGLEMIANPRNKEDSVFYGWYVVNSDSAPDDDPIVYTWTENPAQVLFETPVEISFDGTTVNWTLGEASGSGTVDEDGCTHVYLAPIYEDYYFVNFHLGPIDDPGLAGSLMTRKMIVLGSDGEAEIRIGNVQAPSPDAVHKIFTGWQTAKPGEDGLMPDVSYITLDLEGNEINHPDGKTGYYITATEKKDIDLYPVFAEARWVYFHTGKSGNNATYVGAKYLLTSDDIEEDEENPYYFDSLPVSQRNGYSFEGWFTEEDSEENGTGDMIADPEGNLVNSYVKYDTDGTTKLYEIVDGKLYFYKAMEDLHLYAKWVEVPDTSYSVIIWKQKVTDDKDAANSDKTYDYEESHTVLSFSGRTLEEILSSGELNAYISKGVDAKYTGFYYRTAEMSTDTVKGDKTTVVNLYYDRELRAINFYYRTSSDYPADATTGYTYTATTGSNTPQYGLSGDQYVELSREEGTTTTEYYLSQSQNGDEYTGTVYDAQGNVVTNPVYGITYYRYNWYGSLTELYWRSRSVTTYTWVIPVYEEVYQVDNTDGIYGKVGDEYVLLSEDMSNITYTSTGNTYTSTTSNSGTQYGIVDGKIQRVYRNNGNWRETDSRWGTRYNGYRYTQSDSDGSTYTGQLYEVISGTAGNNQTGFEETTATTGSGLYGRTGSGNNSVFFQLEASGDVQYTYVDSSGDTQVYEGDRYSLNYVETGSQEYSGTRFTRSNNSNYRMITWTGLYGQSFAQNGYSWDDVSEFYWREGTTTGGGTGQTFLDAFIQDYNPYNLTENGNRGSNIIYHYRQQLDGTYTTDDRETAYSSSSGGFNFTNKFEGFTVSTYSAGSNGYSSSGGNYDASPGSSTSSTNYPLHVYHTRNSYTLTFDSNYPLDKVIYFDGEQWDQTYDSTIVENEEHTLLYETPLSSYSSTGDDYWEPKTPDHYTFGGWYEDATCTVPFNFNSTMPSANKVIYAKWVPVNYRVHINPNGAEIDHIDHAGDPTFRPGTTHHEDKATYINADYGTTIAEYTLTRDYVPISDAVAATMDEDDVYYYIYTKYYEDTGKGLPADLRNALYVTEDELDDYYDYYVALINVKKAEDPERYGEVTILGPAAWRNAYVSTQKYRQKYLNETYVFLGWYKDDETMPYNFSDPVDESFTLTAHWRLDGGYTVMYTPEYTMPDGTLINGNIDTWQDPGAGATYADQATTTIQQQPTDLTANGTAVDDDSYIFRGWQVVTVGGTVDDPTYTPLEEGVYYQEGDEFVIEAKYANESGLIYLQAVYEAKESSYRRPEIANLTLDANTGYITTDGETELDTDQNLDQLGDVGTVALDAGADEIIFGDIQSNIAVHVEDYAVNPNYFKHPDGYFLLGFDDEPDEKDYVATYAADSIISVQRTDEETIYAVWEPMVYINFVNDTGIGDVIFNLSSTEDTALYVVNAAEGTYERVPIRDLTNIKVPKGETLRLAIPRGAEEGITISGTNTLGAGQVLVWNSKVTIDDNTYDTADGSTTSYTHTVDGDTHSHSLAKGQSENNEAFSFDETLIVNEQGLTVTFTSLQHDRTLVLHDNYRDNTQEIYFANPLTTGGYDLPTPSTRLGYEFIGWDTEQLPDNTTETPDYPVGSGLTNVSDFFGEDQVKTLYALWKAKAERGETFVYKTVPEPGDQNKEFTFTVSISGQYKRDSNNYTYDLSGNTSGNIMTHDFTLKHGQFLKVTTSKDVGTAGEYGRPWIQAVVEKYDSEEAQTASETVTLRWQPSSNIYGTVTFDNYAFINVTENDYSADYYDTALEKAAETQTDILTLTQDERKVSWTNTDAGGTVFYTNTRQTADVAVKKNLVSNSAVGAFTYTASYTLGEETKDLGTFTVNSTSETGYVLTGIPVGASLTITETEDNSYLVGTAFANGSTDTNAADNVVAFSVPNGGETVTYTNTLKSYPVKIVKVDQNGDVGVEARFDLSQDGSSIIRGKYTTPTDNVIYNSNLYVGTYTLTETWTQPGYLGLSAPVTLTLSGDGTLSLDNSGATVTGNANDGFTVTVVNHATKNVTVKKVLSDPLASQRTFSFTASYEVNGVQESFPAFSITSTAATAGSYILTVPAGANLTVSEDTATSAATYDTTVTIGEGTVVEESTCTLSNVQEDTQITFTNTRKTSEITVVKEMSDTTSIESFPFTVTLKNGAIPLNGYLVFTTQESGSTVEHRTTADGQVTFDLSHGTSQKLTVPVGTVLVISEESEEYIATITSENETPDGDSADNSFTFTVSGSDTITFLNKPQDVPVILKKVGYDNTDGSTWNLEGATFKIYSDQDGTIPVVLDGESEFTSDGNGILYEGKIPAGTYYLKETVVPDGYYGGTGMYILSVSPEGVTLNSTSTIGSPDLSAWITSSTEPTTNVTTYTVAIRNTIGYALPSSGGPGTRMLTVIGFALVLAAGGILALRRKINPG